MIRYHTSGCYIQRYKNLIILTHEKARGAINKIIFLEIPLNAETVLHPWLFHHDDLIRTMASADTIDKMKLTNILNYLHFKNDHLYILLKHPRYEEGILVKAHPEPCLGDELSCHWNPAYSAYKLEQYHFQHLVISHNQSFIIVPAQMRAMDGNGLTVQLPEQSFVSSQRQTPRFPCQGVKAELWQNGFEAKGTLIDFGPNAFRIRVQSNTNSPSSFQWFNVDAPSIIRLSGEKDVYYSGSCSCLYQKEDGHSREIILTHTQDQIQRFKAKVLRNPRKRSSPPLHTIFEHPFIKKQVQYEIFDISPTGFSISGKSGEIVLIPGMIIPDMTITYAGILKIRCKAQVIYRKESDEQVRFGLTIMDMDLKNYHNLNQLLNNIPGADQGMTNEVDLDQLWELFFESNFIYPTKYKSIQAYRESFQRTYRKLYEDASEIAQHFTYQKNGRIYSHISLIRAYQRTWMGHHHAARSAEGRHTGLIVLKQMISYLYDMHRLPSASLDYYTCYYRPGTKFTDRIYSGFAKEKSDPRVCSMDLYTYLSYKKQIAPVPLPKGWFLKECTTSDLWAFEQLYKHRSGGLLLNVLSLDYPSDDASLEQVYAKIGFVRRWKAYALSCAGELKAVIIAEESDVAMNLSDLLNGFKILIVDPDIRPETLLAAVESMAKNYPTDSLPLLIYPADYAQNKGLPFDKQYWMWILDAQIGNEFLDYLGRKFRMNLA